jgi:ABC-type sulfate transport system permease component
MKNKKLLEIFSSIVFLIIAVLFLIAFLFLHYSSEIKDYIKYIDSNSTTTGLRLYVIYGFAKLLTLLISLSIILSLIFKKFFRKTF